MSLTSLVKWTTCAIVLACVQTASVRADVILDNFSTPGTASTLTFSSTGTSIPVDTSSVLGGTRTTTADVTTVSSFPFGGESIGAGSFSFNTGTGGVADTTLSYTGLNLDLSPFSNLSLVFSFIGSSAASMPFSVLLNGVTGTTPTAIDISPGTVTALIPLTGGNFSGVDLTSINSITLNFNDPNPTTGFTLNSFNALSPINSGVPEPSSAFIWGLAGLVGLCFGCRNLRGKVAV